MVDVCWLLLLVVVACVCCFCCWLMLSLNGWCLLVVVDGCWWLVLLCVRLVVGVRVSWLMSGGWCGWLLVAGFVVVGVGCGSW